MEPGSSVVVGPYGLPCHRVCTQDIPSETAMVSWIHAKILNPAPCCLSSNGEDDDGHLKAMSGPADTHCAPWSEFRVESGGKR